ncbi:hypothetical protein [Rhizobium mongolense]|uniref:hypothetical protein n=1 Tax=Rhizobium mongolense TaxID=57676 RepID=UPI0034A415DD
MPSLFETYDIDVPRTLINAVPKRQIKFLAGRILSRAALERLHQPSASIAIGKWGSGSISHSYGKCVCLVVADEARLVGIDVEKVPTGAPWRQSCRKLWTLASEIGFFRKQRSMPPYSQGALSRSPGIFRFRRDQARVRQ